MLDHPHSKLIVPSVQSDHPPAQLCAAPMRPAIEQGPRVPWEQRPAPPSPFHLLRELQRAARSQPPFVQIRQPSVLSLSAGWIRLLHPGVKTARPHGCKKVQLIQLDWGPLQFW